jgi:nitroreductase
MPKQAIKTAISEEALNQLFREGRTHSAWLSEPVPEELLRKIYGLARLGPTSANSCPARFVFLTFASSSVSTAVQFVFTLAELGEPLVLPSERALATTLGHTGQTVVHCGKRMDLSLNITERPCSRNYADQIDRLPNCRQTRSYSVPSCLPVTRD